MPPVIDLRADACRYKEHFPSWDDARRAMRWKVRGSNIKPYLCPICGKGYCLGHSKRTKLK